MPGIVRPYPKSGYEVVAGHHRWRACELAGLEEMPVIIRDLDDDAVTVIMVDTNIQREDILPSEKAKAYKDDWVYIIFTVEEIMELLGCARQKTIKNIVELDTEKGISLIEKKRLGFGKPNVIYVKNFMIQEYPEPKPEEEQPENAHNTQKYEKHTSGSSKIKL